MKNSNKLVTALRFVAIMLVAVVGLASIVATGGGGGETASINTEKIVAQDIEPLFEIGKTDSNGSIEIYSENLTGNVKIEVTDQSANPLPDINVEYYEKSSIAFIIVSDPNDYYQPGIFQGHLNNYLANIQNRTGFSFEKILSPKQVYAITGAEAVVTISFALAVRTEWETGQTIGEVIRISFNSFDDITSHYISSCMTAQHIFETILDEASLFNGLISLSSFGQKYLLEITGEDLAKQGAKEAATNLMRWLLADNIHVDNDSVFNVKQYYLPAYDEHEGKWNYGLELSPERCDIYSDSDDDGWNDTFDCADYDNSVYPGATEVCYDATDNNCDGELDEGCAGQAAYQDDFEDGVIDKSLWVVGGQKGGYGGCGNGYGQWFNEEIIAADGYLQARVTTSESTVTYGSDAWIRTVHDFNDGKDWIINFKWEPDIQTVGQWHADYHVIEITDGRTDWQDCVYHAPAYQVLPSTYQLYNETGIDLSPTDWSIVINASAGEATLYEGPDGTGPIHATRGLNTGDAWHIRFITSVATSEGFPAKICRINLYDFSASSRPDAPPSVTPPDQPADGPGSNNYTYPTVLRWSFGVGATAYDVFGPYCWDCESSLPVIVFLHGWSMIWPEGYRGWIDHLVRRGNIVIYPKYQADPLGIPFAFTNYASIAIKDAMRELNESTTFHFTPDWSMVSVVGHSLGGVIAANLPSQNNPELPRFKAVMVVEAGGMEYTKAHDYSKMPAGTLLVCVVGEEDDGNQKDSRTIFETATNVRLENKDFITAMSDYYGTPPLIADHYAPASYSDMTDALDYFGFWKWFDGLCDAAFYGTDREYALGDTPEQRYMGRWSDGTLVKESVVTDSP